MPWNLPVARRPCPRRLALWVLLVTAYLLAPPGSTPATAQEVSATHVAGNVWRIDGAIDVLVVQTGPDGTLLVDTGYPFAETGVRAALRAVAGTDTVRRLINTHVHHAFANHLYGGAAEIVAHQNAARAMAGGFLMAGRAMPPMPGVPAAAGAPRTFQDSLRLRMNGEDILILHLPSAHTDGDAAVFFEGSGVVATGDAYVPHMPWISVDQGAGVTGLLGALDALLARMPPGIRVVPGHDGLTADRQDVVAFRAMVAAAADTVRRRMEAGLGLGAIQARGLPGLEAWEGSGVPMSLFVESLYRSMVRARATPTAPAAALVNGRWWDGSAFLDRTMYVRDGVFTATPSAAPLDTVDLEGGWVVPPFGDAHTHMLGDSATLAADLAAFAGRGVLAVMVQDPMAAVAPLRRPAWAPEAPDVAYTQGVVAPTWSVIPDFYRMMAAAGRFGPEATLASLDGDLIFQLDTPAQLAAAWPPLRERNDRFVKVIVAFADEVAARRADPARYGADPGVTSARAGVTPEVLRDLVAGAHADGLLVSAHIETAADFRLAVEAGADLLAHMPGSWQLGAGTGYGADDPAPWLLGPADAAAARAAGTVVVTTLGSRAPGHAQEDLFRAVHRNNLRVLMEGGVRVILGSDGGPAGVVDEVLYLGSLDVLGNAQLLNLLVAETPRAIFPELRLGHLRPGFEASYVVLGGDPTADLAALRDVRRVVKRGISLRPAAPPPPTPEAAP